MEALEVRRVQHSADLAHPGEYVFVPKREPTVTIEKHPVMPPYGKGLFAWLWWEAFGKKYELKQVLEFQWPSYDAVLLQCPQCNQACATTSKHNIVSIEPLTIETSITCPYCQNVTFKVAEGKLMPA